MSQPTNMKDAMTTDKPPIALLPFVALREVAWAFQDGLRKYEINDWRKGTRWRVYADAALRHIGAWLEGEERAKDSGVRHLAHACACLLILLYYTVKGIGHDDRYPEGIQDQDLGVNEGSDQTSSTDRASAPSRGHDSGAAQSANGRDEQDPGRERERAG